MRAGDHARTGRDPPASAEVVDAFLAAARGGDFATLLALLDPDVETRVDRQPSLHGAGAVARFFAGRARTARPALLDGTLGFIVTRENRIFVAVRLTVAAGRITAFDAITDPAVLAGVVVTPLGSVREPPGRG